MRDVSRGFFLFLFIGIFATAMASTTAAQAPLQVGDRIPISFNSRQPDSGQATPTEQGWRYQISHPGATYIAVHFANLDLQPGDRLLVSDAAGNQSYLLHGRGKMEAGRFWGQHVKGDTMLLELISPSSRAKPTRSAVVVDEYAAGFTALGSLKALCGTDDKENAICYSVSNPTEYDHARAVARLLINGSGLCTGWLVSGDNHLITNEHCITTASDALNTDYEFMAEAPNCNDSNCQLCHAGTVFSGATFIQDSASLDYALVQVNSGNPADAYGYLELDNRPAAVGEQIYIPQHPGGRAKELGIYSSHASDSGGVCQVNTITADPCSGSGYNDVGYYCDTEGGSSGSPVLASSSNRVIALHHCANCPNRGVPINLIYPEIADIIISSGLRVTPSDGLDAAGDPGGPFSPDSIVYTLENLNATPIDFSVTKGRDWVSLSNTGGTLSGGATTTVTVSINSNADVLAAGRYNDTVSFINTTDHDGDTPRDASLSVGSPTVISEWNMDSDPGWSTEGLWAWGQPSGGGGAYGEPDPTSGATGSNVYGYNLSGDYENSLPERHLTSGAIDCTGLSAVTLKFQRWLGVEQPAYDHAAVRVSTDGSSWTTVWENGTTISDTAWTPVSLDLSAIADNQSTLFLRWTMGTTDGSWQYCGWNIDDVQIEAYDGVGCTVPADCDDGLYCNGVETCDAGTCQSGTPVNCADSVACTTDSCDESSDSCVNQPDNSACDNGLFCDGAEVCDPVIGCQAGSMVDCNDGVLCTNDACNETDDVCDNIADDSYCDDGLFCNGAETCDIAADCQSGSDPCPGLLCDEPTDQCLSSCNNNGVCEAGEDCNNCANDCISGGGGAACGNGVCEAGDGEDCKSCPSDCNGITTGSPSGRFCCGDGDCSDSRCNEGGFSCTITPQASYCCGDGNCTGAEDPLSCSLDCSGSYCGDGTCDIDENSCSCSADCGLPATTEVPGSTCADSFDNDCDGLFDCDDSDCDSDPACPTCGTVGTACNTNADCCSNNCGANGKCKK